jgi:alanine racemase
MNTNRPTFAKIDLDALAHNYDQLRRRLGHDLGIMAVVKADAYGHGSVPVGTNLERLGVQAFGVAFCEEGIQLREGGISKPILILGGIYYGEAAKAKKYALTPVIISWESAKELSAQAVELGETFDVHVKIDTGMTRIGLEHATAIGTVQKIAALPGIRIKGLISHLATVTPDLGDAYWMQMTRFKEIVETLAAEGIAPPFIHLANSSACLAAPKPPFNMVRPGILLLGIPPGPGFETLLDLKPVFSLTSGIFHLKTVGPGNAVSYEGTFTTERETRIATLPIGYADGLSRKLSNCGYVLVRGQKAPIVGNVCMDMCMIDVTDIPDAAIGDECVFIGEQLGEKITAWEVAKLCDSIPYEIFCNINHRVSRIYLKRQ